MTKQKTALYTLKVIVHYVKSLSAKNTEKIMPKCLVQSVQKNHDFRTKKWYRGLFTCFFPVESIGIISFLKLQNFC